MSRVDHLETSLNAITRAMDALTRSVDRLQHSSANPANNSEASVSSTLRSSQPLQARQVKLDFPRFDGTDPLNWIFRAEQFFSYYDTPDPQRLTIAAVHMEGSVIPWFQMLQKSQQVSSWVALAEAIEHQYGPSQFDCPRAQLFKLAQIDSVASYYQKFTVLANRATGLSDDALLDCFVSGLKPHIRRDVVAQSPSTLLRAVDLARLFDEKDITTPYSVQPKAVAVSSTYSNLNPSSSTNSYSPVSTNQKSNVAPLLPTPSTRPLPTIKRISPAEMQIRREKGLCYNCDEKFSPSHKCRNRQFMLMLSDPDEGDSPPLVDSIDQQDSQPVEDSSMIPHLSFHAYQGSVGVATIRFTGSIDGTDVQVLLDGGSSDNFITPRIAQHLQLPIEPAPAFKVLVGNGSYLESQGIVRALHLIIQGHRLVLPAYVLPIAGSDVILGAAWLATLGPHVADYNTSVIKFYLDGQFITLQGFRSTLPTAAHLHHLKRLQSTDAILELFTLSARLVEPESTESVLLPSDLPKDLFAVLKRFQLVFSVPHGLPPSRSRDHAILLEPNSAPVKVRSYRYPFSQKTEIEKLVANMLDEGLIQPSTSPFSAPVLLVKKKDGTWRFCVDYRALNAITIKDSFPIPTVDELLDELHGSTVYSKLDLRSGFHQVLLRTKDREKTAFRTHHGHYEWLVMPFGLTNAPATFQALMTDIFRPFLRRFVLIFFDDILIYSPSWHTHLEHLTVVLEQLIHHHLYAKLSKCSFGQSRIEYLGHIVSAVGVEMDASKVKAVMDWPIPQTITQLRGFLGLTGYYRRFIRQYASIALPLTQLLQKDKFLWSTEAQTAFLQLKHALSSAPVLALPDFSQPFVIETDASGQGIGAVLSQNGHPIAYFSKKLSPRMSAQSAYVQELFAITEAVAKFRHYLLGHYFIIRTDHKSLKHLSDQVIQTPEQQEWLPKLMGYHYSIEYKPGAQNQAADALSRSYFFAFSVPRASIIDDIYLELRSSSELQDLLHRFHVDPMTMPHYFVRDGLLFFKDRIVIPHDARSLIMKILQEFHSSAVGGHSGFLRTLARISTQFFWKNMRNDIRSFVQHCQVCQQAKVSQLHPAGLLSPLPIPNQIWEDVAMDFITNLPVARGYSVIMVVIDRLSKYCHLAPLRANFTSFQVAEVFVNMVVKLHGVPRTIVSDRDKTFTSAFWQHLFRLQGTTLAMSSSYHPQTDGQSEALNKCIEMYLRCFVHDHPRLWIQYLPWAEFWYNSSFHTSIGMTPFKAVYGRDPPAIVRVSASADTPSEVLCQLQDRDALLDRLKANLLRAQERMKRFADTQRIEVSFNVGDWVFVKLQPYRQHSVQLRKSQKLGMRYFGPFQVLARVGSVAYKLSLPPETRIHPVFHVSLLKKCIGNPDQQYIPLPLLTADAGPLYQPQNILSVRQTLHSDGFQPEVLVTWDGPTEPTWESLSQFAELYPHFDLEDKVIFDEGGNVTLRQVDSSRNEVSINSQFQDIRRDQALTSGLRRSNRTRKLSWKLRE